MILFFDKSNAKNSLYMFVYELYEHRERMEPPPMGSLYVIPGQESKSKDDAGREEE